MPSPRAFATFHDGWARTQQDQHEQQEEGQTEQQEEQLQLPIVTAEQSTGASTDALNVAASVGQEDETVDVRSGKRPRVGDDT